WDREMLGKALKQWVQQHRQQPAGYKRARLYRRRATRAARAIQPRRGRGDRQESLRSLFVTFTALLTPRLALDIHEALDMLSLEQTSRVSAFE
ncbi:hypothetical protein, partial [Thiocystis violacea]|uniref:hypothetical protein n=1 Tax=Thiocystis violacea TaxID=13725 RepID=UPI001A92C197